MNMPLPARGFTPCRPVPLTPTYPLVAHDATPVPLSPSALTFHPCSLAIAPRPFHASLPPLLLIHPPFR